MPSSNHPHRLPVRPLALAALAATLLAPRVGAAQAPAPVPAKGTVGAQAAASTGTANIDDGKFATLSNSEAADATEAEVSAGGLFNTGNARAAALTGAARFRIRRKIHEFSTNLVGNYAQASVKQADGTNRSQSTAGNVQGRVRYDVFFHPRVSFFAMATARHDPFLGLNLRLRIDPGFAFFVINQPKHRLWGELGYDFLVDRRRIAGGADATACPMGASLVLDIPNVDPMMPQCASARSASTHGARAFVGYANLLSEYVTFSTGLEYIQGFAPLRSAPAETDGGVARLKSWVNWDIGLTTSLTKNFAFATTFTLRYDNAPLRGVKKLDTITAFSLVFRFI